MKAPDSAESRGDYNPRVTLPFNWWLMLDEGWQASVLGLIIVIAIHSQDFIH